MKGQPQSSQWKRDTLACWIVYLRWRNEERCETWSAGELGFENSSLVQGHNRMIALP